MWPIIACSIAATAIILERLWALRRKRVIPANLVAQIWKTHSRNKLTNAHLSTLRAGSPLGRVLAAGLVNRMHSREVMKESIEEAGRQVVLELERFLNTLGTIASVSPLLGLLGTVIGMIEVFSAIVGAGVGDPAQLAGGISQAQHLGTGRLHSRYRLRIPASRSGVRNPVVSTRRLCVLCGGYFRAGASSSAWHRDAPGAGPRCVRRHLCETGRRRPPRYR